ncbi:hypothetical protein M513_14161 [Trichuris suis]|uniref:Uncharacterized protein n=1 Tax=Trichuris suis TaxID=68888 RepID=A0A085LJ17_9BILA|nr:hypothetical protein M513_14161 [Trichuris suis]
MELPTICDVDEAGPDVTDFFPIVPVDALVVLYEEGLFDAPTGQMRLFANDSVCREPEQCAACSATADAPSARSIATLGGTEDVLPFDLVVVERPFSMSCLAPVHRPRCLICCENLWVTERPVSLM